MDLYSRMLVGALLLIGQSFWVMFPAYVSGSAAVLFKGKRPMDGGRSFRGKRLFGSGKTWEGFILGGLTGTFAGSMQQLFAHFSGRPDLEVEGMSFPGTFDPWLAAAFTPGALAVIAGLSYGGMTGDLMKSFIKRRMGLERGSRSPFFMDQLDFILGAWLVTVPLFWFWWARVFTIYNVLIVLIMTPILHRAVNIAGFRLGAKKEPW